MTAGLGHVNMVDGDSVNAVGTATTPGAGAAIATIAAAVLPKGKYRVSVLPGAGGTGLATANDMQLKKGATVVGTLFVQGGTTNTGYARQDFEQVSLDGSTALSVNAIAGGAGVYNAVLTATKLPD